MLFSRIAFLTRLVNWIIPKRRNLWIFYSIPDFSGNSRQLFEHVKLRAPEINSIWFVRDTKTAAILMDRGVKAVPIGTFVSWWTFMRADTFVVTHGGFDAPRVARQRVMNLWHGMPLKAIEDFLPSRVRLRDYTVGHRLISPRDIMIATSGLTRALLAAAFGLPPRQVRIVGQPRTDRMLRSQRNARTWLQERTGSTPVAKCVLMLPTYRQGGSVLDGNKIPHVFGDLKGWQKLHSVLEEKDAHALVKLHPSEPDNLPKLRGFSRIHSITDGELLESGLDLYDILPLCDVLITDYSSVFFDFLLLDRPMIFFSPDLSRYETIRTFLLEPYDFWTPGVKVSSLDQLAIELGITLDGHDPYGAHRSTLLPILHTYTDGHASQRIAELLGIR